MVIIIVVFGNFVVDAVEGITSEVVASVLDKYVYVGCGRLCMEILWFIFVVEWNGVVLFVDFVV